jgi:thimet oligopeptidase
MNDRAQPGLASAQIRYARREYPVVIHPPSLAAHVHQSPATHRSSRAGGARASGSSSHGAAGLAPDPLAECRCALDLAAQLLPELVAIAAPRTVDNTLRRYNELLLHLSNAGAVAGLLSEVHRDEAVRDAARGYEQEVSKVASELSLNRDVYDALAAVDLGAADAATRRFHEQALRDYRRAGVNRDQVTRARLQEIEAELTKLGQRFSKNISEDTRAVEIRDLGRLAGLPQDFLDSHPADEHGRVHITTDYPDYNPVMTYATDDSLRRELYVKFRSRGDVENEAVLREILVLRAEKASLLGYRNWADYITEDKMIRDADRADEFINKVWRQAEPKARQEYAELLETLRAVVPAATAVNDWQKVWVENQVKKQRYQVDAEEVRNYFPFRRVLDGLLRITEAIYDLSYRQVDIATWHADVQVFDVWRTSGAETHLGRIYLDMHPRDGKYKHAAQFAFRDGMVGRQLPEGVLVCNFSDPASGPALMEHDDVVTMFHEFGHLMHHILGGRQAWVRQSGVATEFDFVEAPSQMFEEWAWSHDILTRFARHHETGAPIPKEFVEKMRRADKFGLGTSTVQQMFYAKVALEFHRADPVTLDQLGTLKALQRQFTPFPYVEGTSFHTSFGHLVGYSAMYYTYMWSLVIAKDLLTPFRGKDLMSTEVTYRYRDAVLAPGGSKDAAELVRDFLGRDYGFEAFEAYLCE